MTIEELEMFIETPYIQMVKVENTEKCKKDFKNIGSLIGQNLNDVEKLGLEEVNEFRWENKIKSKEEIKRRKQMEKENKMKLLNILFPTPTHTDKPDSEVKDIEVNVMFDEDHVILKVKNDIKPPDLMEQVHSQLDLEKDKSNFCLKILGREEFLSKDEVSIKNYSNIFTDSSCSEIFLVLCYLRNKVEDYASLETLKKPEKRERKNTLAYNSYQKKRKSVTVKSTEIEDNFKIEIGQLKIHKESCNNIENTWLRITIYHGENELVEKVDINASEIFVDAGVVDLECDVMYERSQSKILEFPIPVQCIPRNARFCFGIFKKDKKAKAKSLAWANTTIFDFKRFMKKIFSVFFWQNVNQEPSHDLLNPYKTTEEAYKRRKISTSLEVNILNTFQCSIAFPPEERLEWNISQNYQITRNLRRKTLSLYSDELEKISRRDPLHPISDKEKQLLREVFKKIKIN